MACMPPYIVEKEGQRLEIIENNDCDRRIEMLADEYFSKIEEFILPHINSKQV